MAIQHPDIQPAVNHSVQVAIAGAGPVGLLAELSGLHRTTVRRLLETLLEEG
ncbi:helix-turn-helix domain-containing protein, partial [Escherichia coli]